MFSCKNLKYQKRRFVGIEPEAYVRLCEGKITPIFAIEKPVYNFENIFNKLFKFLTNFNKQRDKSIVTKHSISNTFG